MNNRQLNFPHSLTGRKQTKEHIEKRVASMRGKKRKSPVNRKKRTDIVWNTVRFSPQMDSMLIDLYVNKNLHTRLVSKEMGIGRLPIMRRLKELNIHIRSVGDVKRGIKQSQETKDKRKKTTLERFGGHPWNMVKRSKECLESMSRKAIERLSTTHQYSQGKYFSTKLDQEVFYRSSYELKYMKELDSSSNVLRWEYEPKGYVIRYEFEGSRLYKPDFLVIYVDGTRSLVEIKGAHLMKSEKTKAKVKALGEYQKGHRNDISQCEVLVGKGRKADEVDRIIFN